MRLRWLLASISLISVSTSDRISAIRLNERHQHDSLSVRVDLIQIVIANNLSAVKLNLTVFCFNFNEQIRIDSCDKLNYPRTSFIKLVKTNVGFEIGISYRHHCLRHLQYVVV